MPEPMVVRMNPEVTKALLMLQCRQHDLLMVNQILLEALIVTRGQLKVHGHTGSMWSRVVEHAIKAGEGVSES